MQQGSQGPHVAIKVQSDSDTVAAAVPNGNGTAAAPTAQPQPARPFVLWRPGWVDKSAFILSKHFQAAAQLTTGLFIVALFVLVKPLYYTQSCLTSIFYIAAVLVVQQDNHVGSALFAGFIAGGHLTIGIVFAGLIVMLARAPHVAYTTFLCIFGAIGLMPVSLLRARLGPAALVINLGFVFAIINAQFYWGLGILWIHYLDHAIWTALVSGLGAICGGCLMLPTLARDDMRKTAADTLRAVGVTVSGYSSHLLIQEDSEQIQKLSAPNGGASVGGHAASDDSLKPKAKLSPGSMAGLRDRVIATLEEPDENEYLKAIERETNPTTQRSIVTLVSHRQKRAAELLPNIMLAKRLLGEARYEPPFMSPHRMQLGDWGPLLGALEALIMRCAALESILESDEPMLYQTHLSETLGVDVLPIFRLLYAQVAASCNGLANALELRRGLKFRGEFVRLFAPAWALLEDGLAAALSDSLLRGYWADYMASEARGEPNAKHIQLRALMYVTSLTSEIMDSMVGVENAIESALERQTTFHPVKFYLRQKSAAYKRAHPDSHTQRLDRSVRAVRRALSLRRGQGGRVYDSMRQLDRRSSASLHSPPPDCANMTEATRSKALSNWFKGEVDALGPDAEAKRANGLLPNIQKVALRSSTGDGEQKGAGSDIDPAAHFGEDEHGDEDLYVLARNDEEHPEDAVLDTTGAQAHVYANLRVTTPPLERPLQKRPHSDFVAREAAKEAAGLKGPAEKPGADEQDVQSPRTAKQAQRKKKQRAWLYNEVEWLRLLVEGFCGILLWRVFKATMMECIATCRNRKELRRTVRRGRRFQFGMKYWVGCTGTMAGVLIASQDIPSLRQWNPLYLTFTMVVILSEKFEATLQKSAFRMVGTVAGGVIGYCVMLNTKSATNPYALMVIACTIAFFSAFPANTQYRYLVFLFLITALAVIMCQYSPYAPPGHHGASLYFYARVADVTIGLIIVLAIAMVLPWYSSEAALETLGGAFEDACKTARDLADVMVHELKRSAKGQEEEGEKGIEAFDRQALQKRLGAPLATVQTLMQKDKVLWERGILSTPPVVFRMRAAMDTLFVRLTALEAMVMQKPIITGRYSESPYINFMKPIEDLVAQQLEHLVELGAAVNALVAGDESGFNPEQLRTVQDLVAKLNDDRATIRREYLKNATTFHHKVAEGKEPWVKNRTPDDAARWLSFVFALITCLNKATLVANTVAADPFIQARCRDRSSGQKYLWFGVPKAAAADTSDGKAPAP